jgi:hypothetical protein
MLTKAYATKVFEALGVERVERGMWAFGDYGAPGNARHCFLGRSAGSERVDTVGLLGFFVIAPLIVMAWAFYRLRLTPLSALFGFIPCFLLVRVAYGVPFVAGTAVSNAFDAGGREQAALRDYATEWLELNRVTRAASRLRYTRETVSV